MFMHDYIHVSNMDSNQKYIHLFWNILILLRPLTMFMHDYIHVSNMDSNPHPAIVANKSSMFNQNICGLVTKAH